MFVLCCSPCGAARAKGVCGGSPGHLQGLEGASGSGHRPSLAGGGLARLSAAVNAAHQRYGEVGPR